MLSFLRKPPYLKDLIPEGYTDIHSHLLPGIDDGAQTRDDTLFLVSKLLKIGFARFVTTPHIMANVWDNSRDGIEASSSASINDLEKSGVTVPIRAAAEYLMDTYFVDLFQTEKLLTLADNYVLVEMSYINPPIQLFQIIFDLQVAGYKPVLAHPERYTFYHHNFDEYAKLKNAGCLFQMNLLSVAGYYGIRVAETARKLLAKGLIDFTGSDVHHENHINAFSKRIVIKDTVPLAEAMKNNSMFRF